MKEYDIFKYRVEWQGGSGWFYPDGMCLDIDDDVRAKLTPKQLKAIQAACEKHHRRMVVADVRRILIVVALIVVGFIVAAYTR